MNPKQGLLNRLIPGFPKVSKPISIGATTLALLTIGSGVTLMPGLGSSYAPVTWVAYGASGGSITVHAERQILEPATGHTQLISGVHIAMDNTVINGSNADITVTDGKAHNVNVSGGAQVVKSEGGTQRTINAQNIQYGVDNNSMTASGNVTTNISGGSEGSVTIKSDSQTLDSANNVMRAMGHVRVDKEDLTATSPEAMILMGASGQAEKVVFLGGAALKSAEKKMTAQKITIVLSTGDIYAENKTKSIIVNKDAKGKPTEMTVESHLQELDKATGMLIANGQTKLHFEDTLAKGPKAVFYMKNNQLDHITLSGGRCEVQDVDRVVKGDSVLITMNPKQFSAKGNVQTFIKPKPQSSASAKPVSGKGTAAKGPAKPALSKAASDELMIEEAAQKK